MNHNIEQIINITLWNSSVWAIIILSVWLIFTFITIASEYFFASFMSLLILIATFSIWGSIPPWEINYLKSLNFWMIYISIGLPFACVKTFFYAKKTKKYYSINSQQQLLDNLKNELKHKVLSWWIAWPFEFIIWLLSDLMSNTWNFIWSNIHNLFYAIAKFAIKQK